MANHWCTRLPKKWVEVFLKVPRIELEVSCFYQKLQINLIRWVLFDPLLVFSGSVIPILLVLGNRLRVHRAMYDMFGQIWVGHSCKFRPPHQVSIYRIRNRWLLTIKNNQPMILNTNSINSVTMIMLLLSILVDRWLLLTMSHQEPISNNPGWWFGCHFLFSHILGC